MANSLDGTKVIAITGVVAGPTLGWILADLGADVINIESLGADRGSPAMFVNLNRHKRSLAADLKSPRGKEILSKLVARSDVLIENIAPGAMDRLGFSYEAVKEINPRLIYCSIKGYGHDGPYASRLATDYAMQAEAGLLYMTGTEDEPKRMGCAAIDMTSAVFSALAISFALSKRASTGKGTFIESGLFESAAFLMSTSLCSAIMLGKSPPPFNAPGGFGPIGELFKTADGKHVFLGVGSDAQWQRFCDEFGLEELKSDERFSTGQKRTAERPYIIPLVTDIIAKLPREELLKRFEKCTVNFAAVSTPFETLEHPQLKAPNKTCKVSYAGCDKPLELAQIPLSTEQFTPPQASTVPEFGQHTEEVLGELGYTQDEITALVQEGVVERSG